MKKIFLLFICLHAHATLLHNTTSKQLDLLTIVYVFYGSNLESKISLAPQAKITITDGHFNIFKKTERENEVTYLGTIQAGLTYDIIENEHGTLKIKEKK